MLDTQTPCHIFRSRSRSHSPDNNGGALNLDIKSTKASISTIEDEEALHRNSSPNAIESSELRSRLQDVSHSSIAAEPVAAHWKRPRYDSTETRSPTIEVEENDFEESEPYNPPCKIRKVSHKDSSAAVVASTSVIATDAEEQPKNNEQQNNQTVMPVDPMTLFLLQQRQQSTSFYYPIFPYHGLFQPPLHSRVFADDYQKELRSEPSSSRTTPPKAVPWNPARVEPPSHPHPSSAAVASIH